MRRRPLFWLIVSVLCFIGALYFWRLGDEWAAKKAAPSQTATNQNRLANQPPKPSGKPQRSAIRVGDSGNLNSPQGLASAKSSLVYRLANTGKTPGQLARSDKAILLENALFDTAQPTALPIPDYLRSKGDPGTYIVQSRKPLDDAFRALLKEAGASIVAYVPNNAYLVRASAAVADQLRANSQTWTVLPYEPYYKLKTSLLTLAVEQQPLPENLPLNVLLFADAREATLKDLTKLDAAVLGEDRSPFGPVLKVQPSAGSLSALAGLPGVQEVEISQPRAPANDLSRATVGVAADTITTTNYLGLSGANVLVNINDTGVDETHPDLAGRVVLDPNDLLSAAGSDTSGHGTHVAGIIAGSGLESTTVSNVFGSINPGTNGQYRGKAPSASLFSLDFRLPDSYLQETAARTNAFISNNSWTYGGNQYDLAAASYDAAVRDSLPEVIGSHPMVYVFAAGGGGTLNRPGSGALDNGGNGFNNEIQSPGTAKNVITVGAVEQLRNITNQYWVCTADPTSTNGVSCQTNTPWQRKTDSTDQVAGYSNRGNTGVEIEGDFGRFKPDVVAPGAFVVSTRSQQWDEKAYYNPTNYHFANGGPYLADTNGLVDLFVNVPENAVQLIIRVFASVDLPIYIKPSDYPSVTDYKLLRTNVATIPPDTTLDPVGVYWFFSIGNPTGQTVPFNIQTEVITTNDFGNYLEVLSNLNNSISVVSPYYYRYESGTSMAAGDVAGTLALMQEFFEQRLHQTNSPALMKALLINGARSLGKNYHFPVQNTINFQGWGQVHLPSSLHPGLANVGSPTNSMLLFDQSPTNALATGQSHTRKIALAPDGRLQPLRITLVWTDPPGNPAVGLKLVNDLDLVVTNLDTQDVYFGNDITGDADFNLAWNTNNLPNVDMVNNVENVYIKDPFVTNGYSITVVGHRVNVNAVSAHTNDVVQDYALVISSGDGLVTNALTLTADSPTVSLGAPLVTGITNSFPPSADNPISGGILLGQRVGANTPLMGTNNIPYTNDANAIITLGMTNQWHFYVITNDQNYTNAAFVTFLPFDLSVPRMGVNVADPTDATRVEADIDLYVSTNPGLTNLDPAVLDAADKSVSRGGTEFIVLSNAVPGAAYYIGVKSEDQMAAEYGILGLFSQLPLSTSDKDGNQYLRGVPAPAIIPNGTLTKPGAALVFGIAIQPIHIRRVVVTNSLTHGNIGDLVGNLSHNHKFATLNNHSCISDPSDPNHTCFTTYTYIYEDNGEGNVPGSKPSDGPGTLKSFIGEEGIGVWMLSMVNGSGGYTGQVNNLLMKLEPQRLDTNGSPRVILPHTFSYDSIDIPDDATNLTLCVFGNTLPVDLYVRRADLPTTNIFDYHLTINPPGDCLSITIYDLPPLIAGRYYIGVFNPNNTTQIVYLTATIYRNPFAVPSTRSMTNGPVPILDDAVTHAYITNLSHFLVSSLDVGLLISHPRISDLAITLISPNGTRVLLTEDRGALTTNGLGSFNSISNSVVMAPFYTNNFDDVVTGPYAPGATFDGWNVLSNYMVVYPDLPAPWLSNNFLLLGYNGIGTSYAGVSNSLPVTNSTAYNLSFRVTHAPYLFGMVSWWPLDRDGADIFGGLDGLLYGNVSFSSTTGMVDQAFFGDGIATRMMVPRCPDIDLGTRRGFSIEGWIRPENIPTNSSLVATGATVMINGFEGITPTQFAYPVGTYLSGWRVESGDVDIITITSPFGPAPADTGTNFLDLNGWHPGAISTNFNTIPGKAYVLTFAYTKNPDTENPYNPDFVAQANISITGQPDWVLTYGWPNSHWSPNWFHTSRVFTASSPVTKLQFTSLTQSPLNGGMYLDTFQVRELLGPDIGAPLAEWSDPGSTNGIPQGVQFWFSGLPGTNGPGALFANIWDTNLTPHIIATVTNALTNGGWQHVALTYDATNGVASLYTNGNLAVSQVFPGAKFVPRTTGDLYLGFDPGSALAVTSTVPATANIFAAGLTTPVQPGGGGAGTLPVQIPFKPGQNSFQFKYLRGTYTYDSGMHVVGPEGTLGSELVNAYGGISGYFGGRIVPLVGVFVTDATPQSPPPPTLAFTTNGLGWNFTSLSPAIGQVFFIGDGRTDSGQVQTFIAPSGATRLFLGFPDCPQNGDPGWYGDNSGSVTIAVTAMSSMTSFKGGLDEFSIYERPLSACEVAAISHAGTRGKYGTNVLTCPVTTTVQLLASPTPVTQTFVNGLNWSMTGPQWETNTISFPHTPIYDIGSGAPTNQIPIIVTPLDPNAAVDDFVLSAMFTNYLTGLMHFTENTNFALVPIKFAPSPYTIANLPPTLIFSNDFENVTQRVTFVTGDTLPGTVNNDAFGPRDWTVISGPVTILSNTVVDAVGTNCLALAKGGVQCVLPTAAGHRYRLDYSVRGPGAVSWWNGDVEPLSRRAWDLLGGNHGAFIYGATNSPDGYVNVRHDTQALFFPGYVDPTNQYASKVELGDPANLQLTNALTIEGWIKPLSHTNFYPEQVGQILFRGDSRTCLDPYYLAVEQVDDSHFDLIFHIESGESFDCGVILETAYQPIQADQWQHIAAVFESSVLRTNNGTPMLTNELRLYVNGRRLTAENQEVFLENSAEGNALFTTLTSETPFRDLDPAFSPGISIGNRSRYDYSQPFRGYIDELSVYGRALTDPEIAAIAAADRAGKADFTMPPGQSLAKVSVSLDDVQMDTGYGDNARWTAHSFEFTASHTNVVLTLQGLLPGTIIDGIGLTELPAELDYLPETSLAALNGEDAYGVWELEVWDTRAGIGPVTNALLDWQLNFTLPPINPPPVIHLVHGIPYTNTLVAYGVQNFIVNVPQWATNATNILLFGSDRALINPLPIGVLFDTNQFPYWSTNGLFWPPVTAGITNLSVSNTVPWIVPGQSYYLTVTNPNPVSATFAYGVWYDIICLTNCQPLSNFVWQAGIPRYFQFDIPTNNVPPDAWAGEVTFWLTGARSNLTVVLSQHLPLPDLAHYDYISKQPSTNDEVFLVLTNTTPFPIQTNRWYVGVFNSALTNVPFTVQACYSIATNAPIIIPLTDNVPFVADYTSRFSAPPGPPRWFFFEFQITNYVDGVLFELYNVSGDADLVLQRDTPPGMAPYLDGSFAVGATPEQIVLRPTYGMPDLRGNWYVGIYNNETTNILYPNTTNLTYTIRAVVEKNGLLPSAQPLQVRLSNLAPPHGLLLQWNAVEGEHYFIESTASIFTSPINWTLLGVVTATTPLATFEVLPVPAGPAYYRVTHVSAFAIPPVPLQIELWTGNSIRISWPSAFTGMHLQYALSVLGPWNNLNRPVTVEGNEFVVYDAIYPGARFYRLMP